MSSAALPAQSADPPIRQNWIISPASDFLFIIGTPIIAWFVVFYIFNIGGQRYVFDLFVIVNTAHHLPTFLRIYGDRDLVKRYRWSLLLGPVIPFTACMVLVAGLIMNGRSLNDILTLVIILNLWDLWHFIMQHYGFMRIYDRFNKAPPTTAARMDWYLCWSWFIYIMIASVDWMPGILYNISTYTGINVLHYFDAPLVNNLRWVAWIVAVILTLVYTGYLVWCQKHGFFISKAKLALAACTFGMMYFTYVPNSSMESVISWARQYNPKLERWSFTTGFVTLGIVHVTQYLAIVWRYNRSLATKSASVREGWFKNWFSSNGAVAITAYIGFCLLYGYIVTMGPASSVQPGVYSPDYDIAPMLAEGLKWAAGVLAAILFTSTIIHYYYDGFIWKVRHKENQRNLEMGGNDDNDSSRSKSWWNKDETLGPGAAISLQALYFVPPMLVLIVFYWVNRPAQSYPLRDTKNAIVQLRDAKTNDQKQTARQLTEEALHGLEIQLGIERDILELSKSGSHLTYAADLTYWQSKAKYVMAIADDQSVKEAAVAHISAIDETIDLYEQALTRRGILIHDEDDSKTRQSIYDSIDVLKKERESIQQNTIRL